MTISEAYKVSTQAIAVKQPVQPFVVVCAACAGHGKTMCTRTQAGESNLTEATVTKKTSEISAQVRLGKARASKYDHAW